MHVHNGLGSVEVSKRVYITDRLEVGHLGNKLLLSSV